MRASTHMLAGALLGVLVQPDALTIAAGALGALLPDIDHPASFIGRRAGVIGAAVRLAVRHRGVTHTLIVWALAMVAVGLVPMPWQPAAMALAVGYGSHLWLDALTVTGVPLFWPLSRRIRFAHLRTGGAVESVLELCLLLGLLGAVYAALV